MESSAELQVQATLESCPRTFSNHRHKMTMWRAFSLSRSFIFEALCEMLRGNLNIREFSHRKPRLRQLPPRSKKAPKRPLKQYVVRPKSYSKLDDNAVLLPSAPATAYQTDLLEHGHRSSFHGQQSLASDQSPNQTHLFHARRSNVISLPPRFIPPAFIMWSG